MSGLSLNTAQQSALRRYARDYEAIALSLRAGAVIEAADGLRRARAVLAPAMRVLMDFAAQGHTLDAIAKKFGAKVADLERAFMVAANRLADHYEREAANG